MEYSFKAYGHPNILATHKTTLEITKDKELSKKGTCIIGVNSDFSLEEIKKFLKFKKIKLVIEVDGIKEEILAEINPEFNDNKEIVIRKGDFCSERTLGIKADKASFDINSDLIRKIQRQEKQLRLKFIALAIVTESFQ